MIALAFVRSLRDMKNPSILAFLLIPWIAGFCLAAVLGYILWVPVFSKLLIYFQNYSVWLTNMSTTVASYIPIDLTFWITFFAILVQFLILIPLVLVLPFLVATSFATPIALKVAEAHYQNIQRFGSDLLWPSIKNSLKATLVLIIWWLITLPLSFVPILNLLIPIAILTIFNKRIYTYDVLRPLLSDSQFQIFIKQNTTTWYLAALLLSALSLIPILNLLIPVFGSLLYSHLALIKVSSLNYQSKSRR